MKFFRLFAHSLLALQISLAAFADSASHTRAAFLQVIDRPKVALKPELAEQESASHRVSPESIEAGIAWFVRWLRP